MYNYHLEHLENENAYLKVPKNASQSVYFSKISGGDFDRNIVGAKSAHA